MRHLLAKIIASTSLFAPLFGYTSSEILNCWNIDLSLYTGYVNGQSQELVLDGPHTLSRIDWKINNLWVLGGTAKLNLYNDTIHFSLDGWNKLHADKSTMVDRDYQDNNDPNLLTDISWHPDTHLKTAYAIETEIAYDFHQFSFDCYQVKPGILLGYRYLKYDWSAYGGTFIYDNGLLVGEFAPGLLVISYEETFSIPYIGLQLDCQWKDCLNVRPYIKYTGLAGIRSLDFHALRDITFEDKLKNATYWITGVEARWNVWEWLDLDLRYSYEQLVKSKGTTKFIEDGEVGYHNGAGCKHHQQLFFAGLTARF